MENVFNFRDQLVDEYSTFSRSFSKIFARDILAKVEREYPVHFCRDCGQEYHPVWRSGNAQQE